MKKKLSKELGEEKTKNKRLSKELKQTSKLIERKVNEILLPIFTSGQIRKLLHPNKKRVIWSREDIASAIALRSVSPKAYRYLRKKNHPLPGLSTLRKHAAKVNIQEGVVDSIIESMKSKSKSMTEHERLCVLSFDEIYISQNIEIDRKLEKRVGPHKTVQVGMVRGLFSKWKQPVFFDYDKPLSTEVVNDVISKLYDAGYIVVGVTTDLGGSNQGLWSELNIGINNDQKCFFPHPKDSSLKIFVFADPPHLLKLIRNHFVDKGFYIDDLYVGKEYIEKLLELNKDEYSIIHKLDRSHLDAKATERQNVKTAARLFSNHTSEAILYCGDRGFLHAKASEDEDTSKYDNYRTCADIFQTVDRWFDVLNSKKKNDTCVYKCAYGIFLEQQNDALNKMSDLMKKLRVGSNRSLLPFQKGIIVSNSSLTQLLPYLQEKYNKPDFKISYIFTNRLCQDVLENFFSYIRGMGCGYDKLSALQFKYRMRWYVLGKHSYDMLTDKSNTEEDEDVSLIDSADFTNFSPVDLDLNMRQVMNPLFDVEMENLADKSSSSCNQDENSDDDEDEEDTGI